MMIDWKDEKEFENWLYSVDCSLEVKFYPVIESSPYDECGDHIADGIYIFKDDNLLFEEWYRGWGNFKEHSSCEELAEEIIKTINEPTNSREE